MCSSRNITAISTTSTGDESLIAVASASGRYLSALMNRNDEATISNPRSVCTPACGVRTRLSFIDGPSQITIAIAWNVRRAQTSNGIG